MVKSKRTNKLPPAKKKTKAESMKALRFERKKDDKLWKATLKLAAAKRKERR